MISIVTTFFGARNDGALYQYKRPFPKATNDREANAMDWESLINF